jgi:hypothetical protein
VQRSTDKVINNKDLFEIGTVCFTTAKEFAGFGGNNSAL